MKNIAFKISYILYKRCNYRYRKTILNFIKKCDGGEMNSLWLRKIFNDYHNILIGAGSYGGCFKAENVNENTIIGKYCSIAPNVYIYNRDHPCMFISTHPIFFNEKYGNIPEKNKIQYRKKVIGNDVWIGQNAIILASVGQIGDGAIIGAGAVVTKDVPAYAIVAGIPAKIIGYRFDDSTIEIIKSSKWWDWDLDKLKTNNKYFSDKSDFIKLLNQEQGRSVIQ